MAPALQRLPADLDTNRIFPVWRLIVCAMRVEVWWSQGFYETHHRGCGQAMSLMSGRRVARSRNQPPGAPVSYGWTVILLRFTNPPRTVRRRHLQGRQIR
jgi:hypothetical protein